MFKLYNGIAHSLNSTLGRIKASDLFCGRIPTDCQPGVGGRVSKEGFLESCESALACLAESQAQKP